MFMEIPMLDIDPGASLASCCDGPDCQPAPYGTGNAWYGIGTHHGGSFSITHPTQRLILVCTNARPTHRHTHESLTYHRGMSRSQATTPTPVKVPTTPTTCGLSLLHSRSSSHPLTRLSVGAASLVTRTAIPAQVSIAAVALTSPTPPTCGKFIVQWAPTTGASTHPPQSSPSLAALASMAARATLTASTARAVITTHTEFRAAAGKAPATAR